MTKTTIRPTLRSSWEMVWPRRSRSVVTESSPSSTAASIRDGRELAPPGMPARRAARCRPPGSRGGRRFAVDLEDLGDAGEDIANAGLGHGPNLETPAGWRQRSLRRKHAFAHQHPPAQELGGRDGDDSRAITHRHSAASAQEIAQIVGNEEEKVAAWTAAPQCRRSDASPEPDAQHPPREDEREDGVQGHTWANAGG